MKPRPAPGDLAAALTRVATAAPPDTRARKALLVRLDPDVHRRLRVLAAQHDTTVQQLGEEAIALLFEHYGAGD